MTRSTENVPRGANKLARRMHPTHNDMPQKTRDRMADLLNARLADCSDLASQARTAHWNVKGPQFIALHKLFDEIYENLSEQMDLVAERCVQLGGTAKGTTRLAAQHSQIEEYPVDIFACEDHVRELSKRLATYGKSLREAIDESEEAEDMGTSDMFTALVQEVDKWVWMVEAHIQESR